MYPLTGAIGVPKYEILWSRSGGFPMNAITPAQWSVVDQLIHTTVRIDCWRNDGSGMSGTGFFFKFCERETQNVPAIITNKHVIDGASQGAVYLSVQDAHGAPLYGEHLTIRIDDFQKRWIPHPLPDVDLAALPLAPLMRLAEQDGKQIFFITMNKDTLADAEFLKSLVAVEDILMVGYPNGLWDAKNNLPIVRRGITATAPYIDFEGRREFMIDCACFPGSSGSPVMLYNLGYHINKDGGMNIGSGRVKLLGVLWGGPSHTAEGSIKAVPVPHAMGINVFSRVPNNLGYCVKATELLAFEEVFA